MSRYIGEGDVETSRRRLGSSITQLKKFELFSLFSKFSTC